MEAYFKYSDRETGYLRRADERLAGVIDRVGVIKRPVIPDLFAALMHCIVGQQISTKAHETIWQRMLSGLGEVTPQSIASLQPMELQAYGLSFRKVDYMQDIAREVMEGKLDIGALSAMSDEQVCKRLCELRGIGVWSAEMLMLFSMQRPDILSRGDLAIVRGLRMVYGHRTITPSLFERYRRRFSPYGSVASLYLWAVAGGAIPELSDPATTPLARRRPVAKGSPSRGSSPRPMEDGRR